MYYKYRCSKTDLARQEETLTDEDIPFKNILPLVVFDEDIKNVQFIRQQLTAIDLGLADLIIVN